MESRLYRLARYIIEAGALEIRDVDAGEDPFLYASGNWGPGYVSIKGLVAKSHVIKSLVVELARKVREVKDEIAVDFVAGNVTGGVIPGWILAEELSVPYVYVRETRKKGGQKEQITGIQYIPIGTHGLVVEELVNFAETTCNSAGILRQSGYEVGAAATILFYNNPEAVKKLYVYEIRMIFLLTLEDLLKVAERTYSVKAIKSYRQFLQNPLQWQADRGLKPVEKGGTI